MVRTMGIIVILLMVVISTGCFASVEQSEVLAREAELTAPINREVPVATETAAPVVTIADEQTLSDEEMRGLLEGPWEVAPETTEEAATIFPYRMIIFITQPDSSIYAATFGDEQSEDGFFEVQGNHLILRREESSREFDIFMSDTWITMTLSTEGTTVTYRRVTSAPTPTPSTMEEVQQTSGLVGTWRFIGLGDSNVGGTPMPATSPEVIQFNEMLGQLTIEYQFNEDGTTFFRANGTVTEDRPGVKLEPETISVDESGTYEISGDGETLAITAEINILNLLGMAPSSMVEFTMTRQGSTLSLRYSVESSPGSFIVFNFEKTTVIGPTNTSEAIIGKWRLVGIGDRNVNSTSIPADSPETIQMNSGWPAGFRLEYQFYKDGTVEFHFSDGEPAPHTDNITEIGTYKVIADGTIIEINLSVPNAGLASLSPVMNTTDVNSLGLNRFNVKVNNNKLTLRFNYKVGSSSDSYVDGNFEKYN